MKKVFKIFLSVLILFLPAFYFGIKNQTIQMGCVLVPSIISIVLINLEELKKSISKYNETHETHISSDLVVLADPAKMAMLCGTKKDICIPNACLNSTVSGLVSRTIENKNYIGKTDFHGAITYSYLKYQDYSNYFITEIEKEFTKEHRNITLGTDKNYVSEVLKQIMTEYQVDDKNKIKLSMVSIGPVIIPRNGIREIFGLNDIVLV